MVSNRKILVCIKTEIAQREADVVIPDQLKKWFGEQLIDVDITPNYQEL